MPDYRPDPDIVDEFTTVDGHRAWHVASQTRLGWLYTVVAGEYALTCDCKWSEYHSTPADKPCAHRRVVEAFLEDERARQPSHDGSDDLPAYERAGPVVHNGNRPFSLWKDEDDG